MNQLFEVIAQSDAVRGVFDLSIKFPLPSPANADQLPIGFLFNELVDWKFPITFAVTYYVIVSIWKRCLSKEAPTPSSTVFKALVCAHNAFLCVFSALCFLNVMPRIVANYSTRPLGEAYCDMDGSFWASGVGYWSWLFYLSKYYEVIDTLILLLKGRAPSFLQSYHHAGAILAMWLGSGANSIWVFVVFNSFIHTIMYHPFTLTNKRYFYYTLATFGYQPFWKRYLTTLQIVQFFFAGVLGLSYMFTGCAKVQAGTGEYTMVDYLSHAFVVVYVVPLTALFIDFAKKSYYSGDKKEKKGKAKVNVVKSTPQATSPKTKTTVKKRN